MINSDTGWYKCDFTQASNSPFGLGAGCDFVNENCIVDEMVPDYGKGFFCNEKKEKKWTCGPSHMFRGTCDLEEYSSKLNLVESFNKKTSYFFLWPCKMLLSPWQTVREHILIKILFST